MSCKRRLYLRILWFLAAACLVPGAVSGASDSPRELFEKGKAEFKIGSYRSSLATFERLDQVSRQPGLEQERSKLEPVIAFYRGANHAALGETQAAKAEFQTYLAFFPAADIDRAAFPRSVIAAFQKAREESAADGGHSQAGKAAPEERGIAAAYARFESSTQNPSPGIDERWAEGPVRYLLTKSEKVAWDRITGPVERADFISRFWQERDPDPLTTENEFRDEFEKRVRFADTYFSVGEKKGSETDRGLVFALLGPPTYAGQTPLTMEDDPIQVARAAPVQEMRTDSRGRIIVTYVPRLPLTTQAIQGTREIWHYRRDRLPRSAKFQEVDFEFITKEGYGDAVLQREHRVLMTLEDAARPVKRHTN